MIEVRFDNTLAAKLHHETLRACSMVDACRAAGMPVIGGIQIRGIAHGTLTISNETDLDDEPTVTLVRWLAAGEELLPMKQYAVGKSGTGREWTWRQLHDKNNPPLTPPIREDDDEL